MSEGAITGLGELGKAICELREKEVLQIAKARLQSGEDPVELLNACRKGMTVVGQRFEEGDYFISDMMYASAILKRVVDLVKPLLRSGREDRILGRVVFGTVKGDIHGVGKNIVISMLRAFGFEVYDLGVDVPPERFVEKIRETDSTVVGLSALLTVAFDSMKTTIDAISEAGLRGRVRIMVGGGPVDETVKEYVGADAWGKDAMEAVRLCQKFLGVV